MRILLLALLLAGCATTKSSPDFCAKVAKAETEKDYSQMLRLLNQHLIDNKIPNTPKDREQFLFKELRRCGYEIND